MPNRLPVRANVIIGNMFILFVVSVICIIYYAYTFLVWFPKASKYPVHVFLNHVIHKQRTHPQY